MKPRGLVADDDTSVRDSLSRVLADADYEVTAVADGQLVLDRLTGARFDVLILDLDLPVRSGWEVLDSLKNSHPALPTIVITGLPDARTARAARPLAVFMEKPIEAWALLDAIARLLASSLMTSTKEL